MNATLLKLSTACLVAAGLSSAALSQTSPYYIGGSVAYGYQSNPLGLADNASVPAGYASRSDNVVSVSLLGGLDQTIGRQRVFGSLTLSDNRYERNELLNHRNYAVTAGVDWQTIERISGNVTLRSSEDQVRFSTFEQPTGGRNLVKSDQADASARIGVVTRYTLEAGAGYRNVEYSEPSYAGRNYRQNSGFVGARYSASGSNYVGLSLRSADGRYAGYVQPLTGAAGDNVDRKDIQLAVNVEGSGASSLYLQAAHTDIEHDVQKSGDFSGFTGLLRGTWTPAGKVQLSAELARDRGQDIAYALDAFGSRLESARLATAARLGVTYAATAKVELHSNAVFTQRSVIQGNPFLNIEERGRERATQWSLGVSWVPTRTSRIGCDLTQEKRRADLAAVLLNATSKSATCSAQLTLQP